MKDCKSAPCNCASLLAGLLFLAFSNLPGNAQNVHDPEAASTIFEEFVYPVVPGDFYALRSSSKYAGTFQMAFFVKVRTDSSGLPVSLVFDRLLNFSTRGDAVPDSIWKQGEEGIRQASKDWIVRPDSGCVQRHSSLFYCRIRTVYLILNYMVGDFDPGPLGSSVYLEVY